MLLRNNLLGGTSLSSFIAFAPPGERGSGGDGNDDNALENDILSGLELDDSDFQSDGGQDDLDASDDDGDNIDADDAGLGEIGDPDNRVSHTSRRGERQQQQQQPKKSQQQERVLHTRSEVKSDARGNLVDAKGKVVARAGKEARLYQDAHNSKQQVTQLQGHVRQASTKLNEAVRIAQSLLDENKGHKAQGEALKAFNLKPDELLEAARLFTGLRTDTLGELKKLLTRAAASGINITELGNVGGAVDAKAISDLIREQMAPLRESVTQQQQREQQERETNTLKARNETEVTNFFTSNPDAAKYGKIFVRVLQTEDGRKMSLSHIWDKIQLNLLQNGGNQRDEQNLNPDRPTGRRMSNGNGRGNGRADHQAPAPTSASYDDIIKSVMSA